MKDNEPAAASYVDKVREDTGRYVRQLLLEHETLRVAFAQLENESTRMRDENTRLREDLEARRREEAALHQSLVTIREESHEYLRRFSELESSNANLANLYVASYQLHGTLDRAAVLNAIEEIVVNLVGSENFGVFEVSADDLSLACSVGIDGQSVEQLRSRNPGAWTQALNGQAFLSGSEDADGLVACIPLKLDDDVTGVIAIFALLPHKPGLEPVDHELFDLLATHAATALYCTALRERIAAVVS